MIWMLGKWNSRYWPRRDGERDKRCSQQKKKESKSNIFIVSFFNLFQKLPIHLNKRIANVSASCNVRSIKASFILNWLIVCRCELWSVFISFSFHFFFFAIKWSGSSTLNDFVVRLSSRWMHFHRRNWLMLSQMKIWKLLPLHLTFICGSVRCGA